MNVLHPRAFCVLIPLVACLCVGIPCADAQVTALAESGNSKPRQPTREDSWLVERDEQARLSVYTQEMTLQPRAEPRPALKYRLLPDDFDMLDGNAALYYLKAGGFFEETYQRERLTQRQRDASARAKEEGKEYNEVPPAVWRSTPPDQLPVDEVKEYLRLTAFQPWFLREATRRDRLDFDRNLREIDDLFGYLLPEVQSMRELARMQSLRCRVAIAEGRVDDAIEITGQQFALARHMGQDDFLVSNLIGFAFVGIAWNDALYLIQHPDTPNLYWAFAAMPKPLVDLRHALSVDCQSLYGQLKVLREVNETPRPVGYWQDFIDRLLPQMGYLASEVDFPSVESEPELARAAIVAYIAAAYPGAKKYLSEECKLPADQIEAYPTAQVVFLALVRFYDQWRDESFKWTYVPYWQARANANRPDVDNALRAALERYGWCAEPVDLLLPALMAARTAAASCCQSIAMLQTVEAIRLYGADHSGRLPPSLDELPVPAPLDPYTGKPVGYEFLGDHAVLSGHPRPGIRYRLVLRMAAQ